MFYYRLLIGGYHDNATQQIQRNTPENNQRRNCFFEHLIEPCLRNLKAELIIDGTCGGMKYFARLIYNTQQSAVKRTAAVLALESGPIYVQNDIEAGFGTEQDKQDGDNKTDYGQDNGKFELCQGQADRRGKAHDGYAE